MMRGSFILLVTMACRMSLIHAHVCYAGTEPDRTGKVKWVLPYRDPCACTEIRPGGHNTQAPLRSFIPRYLKSLVITKDKNEIFSLLNCSPQLIQKLECENHNFAINCGDDETIDVKWALYGFDADRDHSCFKKNTGTCQERDENMSLQKVKTDCQGKRHCTFTVNNNWYGSDPCSNVGKYLNVTYVCLHGSTLTTVQPVQGDTLSGK